VFHPVKGKEKVVRARPALKKKPAEQVSAGENMRRDNAGSRHALPL
jgi:hypothetical protein